MGDFVVYGGMQQVEQWGVVGVGGYQCVIVYCLDFVCVQGYGVVVVLVVGDVVEVQLVVFEVQVNDLFVVVWGEVDGFEEV